MVDEDPLFEEGGECELPYVPKYDFEFIHDCEVLPPPGTIVDCPDVELPPDPPPPPPPEPPPCPTIEATANVDVTYVEDDPASVVTIVTNTTQGDNGECTINFDLDFDLQIPTPPIPCPTIDAEATADVTVDDDCNAPPEANVTVVVTQQDDGSSCSTNFDFDFSFVIPPPPISCPTINANGTIFVSGGGSGDVGIIVTPTPGGDPCNPDCAFDFDFDFLINLPDEGSQGACPVIYATATLDVSGGTGGGGGGWGDPVYESSSQAGDEPICGGGPTGNVTVHVTPTVGEESCQYDFDFDFHLSIPPPKPRCTEINVTGQATATTTDADEAEVSLNVTATPDGSEGANACNPSCGVTLDFDFQFKIPRGGDGCPAQSSNDSCRGCYGGLTVEEMNVLDPNAVQYILGATGDGCFGLVPVSECPSEGSQEAMMMEALAQAKLAKPRPAKGVKRARPQRTKTSKIGFSKKKAKTNLYPLIGDGFTGLVDISARPMLVFENGVVSQVIYPDEMGIEAVLLDDDAEMGDYDPSASDFDETD